MEKKGEGELSDLDKLKVNYRLEIFEACVPCEFHRKIRSLEYCHLYKIHEVRQFLHYSLFPVFFAILPAAELQHLMLLQHGVLLLGGFGYQPINHEEIEAATVSFKLFSSGLVERKWPCTFHAHQIIHIPEDVSKFPTGIETISAFPYENFQQFFRNVPRSGFKIENQIINRLTERNKFILPKNNFGYEIDTECSNAIIGDASPIIVQFKDKGRKWPKKLIFPEFILTNKFPNNFCLLNNGVYFVVNDMLYDNEKVTLTGTEFESVETAFCDPYLSSTFNIAIVSNPAMMKSDYDCDSICAKLYAFPMDTVSEFNPDNLNQRWFVSPIHHTSQ